MAGLEDLTARLQEKAGPLRVWQWGALGGAGVAALSFMGTRRGGEGGAFAPQPGPRLAPIIDEGPFVRELGVPEPGVAFRGPEIRSAPYVVTSPSAELVDPMPRLYRPVVAPVFEPIAPLPVAAPAALPQPVIVSSGPPIQTVTRAELPSLLDAARGVLERALAAAPSAPTPQVPIFQTRDERGRDVIVAHVARAAPTATQPLRNVPAAQPVTFDLAQWGGVPPPWLSGALRGESVSAGPNPRLIANIDKDLASGLISQARADEIRRSIGL